MASIIKSFSLLFVLAREPERALRAALVSAMDGWKESLKTGANSLSNAFKSATRKRFPGEGHVLGDEAAQV